MQNEQERWELTEAWLRRRLAELEVEVEALKEIASLPRVLDCAGEVRAIVEGARRVRIEREAAFHDHEGCIGPARLRAVVELIDGERVAFGLRGAWLEGLMAFAEEYRRQD